MDTLNIILGYKCNYFCIHCGNNSGPLQKNLDLEPDDYEALCVGITTYMPEKIVYAGGEPTLYLDQIQKITNFHPQKEILEVEIVTNGWFALNPEKMSKILSSIEKLTKINMSFDTFHKSSTTDLHVKSLYEYCINNDLGLKLITSISTPLQLVKLEEISSNYNIPIEFQPVVSSGRAREYNVAFQYPKFQPSSLSKKCPSEGRFVYLPRKGFSVCCSTLAFEPSSEYKAAYNKNIDFYKKSEFYTDIVGLSFGEIAEKYDIPLKNLNPIMSNECSICEHIFGYLKDKR